MSAASLIRAIPAGDRILLDSSVLIAYLDGGEAVSAAAARVIDECVHSGRNTAVIAMLTALEVLVKPTSTSPADYVHVHDFQNRFPNFLLQVIDFPIAQEAASLRATHRYKTPDAIVIATGIVARASRLVCNDDRWRGLKDSRVRPVILADHVPL